MPRKPFAPVGLAGRPQILKQPGPGLVTGTKNDFLKGCAEVGLRITEPRNDPLRPRRSTFEGSEKQRPDFGGDWHDTRGMPSVCLRLRAPHHETAPFPVHITPFQPKVLRRAPQARIASESDDHTPLIIRARGKHGPHRLSGNIEETSGIGLRSGPKIFERVRDHQIPLHRLAKDRLGDTDTLGNRRGGKAFIDDRLSPAICVSRFQLRDGLVPPQMPAETLRGLAVGVAC